MIDFSIIVPTYNSANTIAKAIYSVLMQRDVSLEILIIDSLSSDDTIPILKSFDDDRIKIISEKDNGIYDAMNKGIKHAAGKWLYFLGSDDELYNEFVLPKILQFSRESQAEFVYGNVLIKGHVLWAKNKQVYDGIFDIKKLLTKNICHQSIFYKTSLIKIHHIQFNNQYPVCADWDFNLKCWSINKFSYTDSIIAIFNGGGSSSNFTNDNFSNDIVNKYIEYFKVTSYLKLRHLIPADKQYQLLAFKKFKWLIKLDRILKTIYKN